MQTQPRRPNQTSVVETNAYTWWTNSKQVVSNYVPVSRHQGALQRPSNGPPNSEAELPAEHSHHEDGLAYATMATHYSFRPKARSRGP